MSYITANEVCDLLGISRMTLHRLVYERRVIKAYHLPGTIPTRRPDGKRSNSRVRFLKEDVMAQLREVTGNSERAMKRKAKQNNT